MRRNISHLEEVQMIGKLADLKEEHYKFTLIVSALAELLIEKGVLSAEELQEKAALLDLYGAIDAAPGRKH